jgi:hypothetical protein
VGHSAGSKIAGLFSEESGMAVVSKSEEYFIAANLLAWDSGPQKPNPANLNPGFYVDPSSGVRATIVPVDSQQNIQEDVCLPARFPCNVDVGHFLLTANNRDSAPIHIEFSGDGVFALGSYAVSKWKPVQNPDGSIKLNANGFPVGVAYTASLYVRLLGSDPDDWIPASASQGHTGDIWSPVNPSFAPFVGCKVTAGDKIVAARFDMGHGRDGQFNPVGITNLWFYA